MHDGGYSDKHASDDIDINTIICRLLRSRPLVENKKNMLLQIATQSSLTAQNHTLSVQFSVDVWKRNPDVTSDVNPHKS